MMTSTTITTGLVRFSYVHLFEAYSSQPGQDPKYSVTILLPKTDTATKAAIDAAIAQATQEGLAKWGGRLPATVFSPVWDGDGKRQNGEPFSAECKGCWVFTASCKKEHKPRVVDANLQDIIDATAVKSGDYGRVNINFYAYNQPARKGIGCGLNMAQYLQEGEPLGGPRITAEDAFGAPVPGMQPTPAPAPRVDEFGLPI